MTCFDCKHAEIHGYPPEGTPDGWVATLWLHCPIRESHGFRTCEDFEEGEPRKVRDDVDGGF